MDKEYKDARIKLTLLYVGIILGIIIFFSTALVGEQFLELNRISQYRWRAYSDPFNAPDSATDAAVDQVINQVKLNTLARTAGIDLVLLAASIIVSYYLSGKTLEPIHESFVRQKKFIANASHELKTPLTAMKTQAEILLRSDRSKEEYKEFVESTLEETDRLTQLTYALLDLARSDSHTQVLKPEIFNVSEMVGKVIDTFTPLAHEKHVRINPDLEATAFVYADTSRIEQLVSILIDNAIKYNNKEGTVTIIVQNRDDGVMLSVEDTGMGIPVPSQQKVFDRFYRVSEDRNIPGYGLGLSIAKQIVSEADASITLESEVKKGTTITVIFPKTKPVA